MNRSVAKVLSIVFHPIWMPIIGCLFYFFALPNYIDLELAYAKLLAVSILSIFIPIVFLFISKNLNFISDYQLTNAKERRFFLMFFAVVTLVILNKIIDVYNYRTLFYFFSGILFSVIIALLFSLFKIRISLHTLGVSSLLVFVIGLSLSFQINLQNFIFILIFSIGLVSTARLKLGAHAASEVLFGFLAGIIPQIYFFQYWL
ncbi:hypothetical protein [Psychroflexus aestuariivivens]|uniref:hypothetical protein n=1 Tax=Psychroflexus aestuariivivens TaxID=1795040 RepID=UPI000FDAEA03|nr:hypothetical protein [Psychroflexus aestuariivivens]